MKTLIEYRVRPVTRYVLTRFTQDWTDDGSQKAGSVPVSEFENADTAFYVGSALAEVDQRMPVVEGQTVHVTPPEHPNHDDPTVGYEIKPF